MAIRDSHEAARAYVAPAHAIVLVHGRVMMRLPSPREAGLTDEAISVDGTQEAMPRCLLRPLQSCRDGAHDRIPAVLPLTES